MPKMKKKEKTLNTYMDQQENKRFQLVQINIQDGTYRTIKFQIRKNRKILGNFKWEGDAKKQFYMHIGNELLQTKLL